MYDWNGNGKHDAFDDAMFMALLEDDLERHPPGKKTYRSSSSSSMSFFEEMGCMLYFCFLIFLPLALIVMFLFYGEWDLVLLVILIAVFVHIGLYKILSEPDSKTDVKDAPKSEVKPETKPASTSVQSKHNCTYSSNDIPVYTPSCTSSPVLEGEPDETVRERLDYDLIGTGYDSYDLEWMDEDERNQILEDNLLDPYDYDFDDLD